MTTPSGEQMVATLSYLKTDELSKKILGALQDDSTSVGYGLLACALTLGRLLNVGKTLEDEVEVKWLEDVMNWAGLYFTTVGKGQKES